MAVYTKFNQKDFENILKEYSIGELNDFKGIKEGIENTNYFLKVGEKIYSHNLRKTCKGGGSPFFCRANVEIKCIKISLSCSNFKQ